MKDAAIMEQALTRMVEIELGHAPSYRISITTGDRIRKPKQNLMTIGEELFTMHPLPTLVKMITSAPTVSEEVLDWRNQKDWGTIWYMCERIEKDNFHGVTKEAIAHFHEWIERAKTSFIDA